MEDEITLTRNAISSLNSVRFIYGDESDAIVGLVKDRRELKGQVRDLENKNLKLMEFNEVLKESLVIEMEVVSRERKARKHLWGACVLSILLHVGMLVHLMIKNML